MANYKKIYAVDFDGTLHRGVRYPLIGTPNYYLIEFLKEKRKKEDIVILWTCRGRRITERCCKLVQEIRIRIRLYQ